MRVPRVLTAIALVCLCGGAVRRTPHKFLIEFGWDQPDTRFMRDHMDQLEASPFDGCVFRVGPAEGSPRSFTWNAWGHRRYTAADLDSARQDLVATRFGRFRQNFLRVNVTPGDVDWFESYDAVLSNLELAAHLAQTGHCPGILLDVEMYYGKLWDYATQTRSHPRPWSEVAAQVRLRGAQAMRALERGYPGLTVFLTVGYSMPLRETYAEHKPLPQIAYGLLAPFLDGMASAASARVVIVDGHEMSYGFRDPVQFAAKADTMRHAFGRLTAEPQWYARHLSVAFGLRMDEDSGGKLPWRTDDVSRNFFTPQIFASSVQAALDHADRYVWIYTQVPRWWGPEGRKQVPAVYDSVLRSVRR